MNKKLTFPDGAELNVEYTGSGNGVITVTAPTNEGVDRELTVNITTTDGSATASVKVKLDGRREYFNVADETFSCTDGEFLVLKNV